MSTLAAQVLTVREREVAAMLLDGRSNKQIAEDLVIERDTVRVHLKRLYRKLGARSRCEVIAQLKSQEYTSSYGNRC